MNAMVCGIGKREMELIRSAGCVEKTKSREAITTTVNFRRVVTAKTNPSRFH